MEATRPAIDLPKLKYLIKAGVAAIPVDKQHEQAVLCIGDTGVGKSTILSYLNGAQLTVRLEGMKAVLDTKDARGLKIGHDRYSETSVPTKLVIDGTAFFDCPGFKDNKGEQFEISNSFFIQRLLDIYKRAKLLLVIDESHVTEARADKLPKLLRGLLQSFGTFADIQEGTILVVNRCSEDQKLQDYCQELTKLSHLVNDGKYLFEKEERDFIEYLVRNERIVLFRGATKADQGASFKIEKSDTLMSKIRSSKAIRTRHIKNILSESAKLAIRDFIDQIADQTNAKVEELCESIRLEYVARRHQLTTVKDIIALKEEVVLLLDSIKQCRGRELLELLTHSLPPRKLARFEEDFAAVMFFKDIYDKTEQYYANVQNKIYAELSPLLTQFDKDITEVQKVEEERAVQQRLIDQLKREQLERDAQAKQQLEAEALQVKQLEEQFKRLQLAYTTQMEESRLRTNDAEEFRAKVSTVEKERDELLTTVKKLETENEWLKRDAENMSLEYSQILKELADASKQPSRHSKYEDVQCPHFKNGGKCIHCIRKWKEQQKLDKVV